MSLLVSSVTLRNCTPDDRFVRGRALMTRVIITCLRRKAINICFFASADGCYDYKPGSSGDTMQAALEDPQLCLQNDLPDFPVPNSGLKVWPNPGLKPWMCGSHLICSLFAKMSARITPCASCRDRRVKVWLQTAPLVLHGSHFFRYPKCEPLPGSVSCKSCDSRGEVCSGRMPRQDKRRSQRSVERELNRVRKTKMLMVLDKDPIPPEYVRAGRRGEQAAAERPREVAPFFADAPPNPGLLAQQTQTLQLQLIIQQINALKRLVQQVLARLDQQQHPHAPVDPGFVLPVSMPDPQVCLKYYSPSSCRINRYPKQQIPFGQVDNQFTMTDNQFDIQDLLP